MFTRIGCLGDSGTQCDVSSNPTYHCVYQYSADKDYRLTLDDVDFKVECNKSIYVGVSALFSFLLAYLTI